MWKFISAAWGVWKFISPIYNDIMGFIQDARILGLKDDAARKQVFQKATDLIQKNGLTKVPDSVLNAGIELVYQVYVWRKA
jgi:hypothetical protein